MNKFRIPPIHRKSPAIGMIIKNVQRDGYFYWDSNKCKLTKVRRELDMLHLEVERI